MVQLDERGIGRVLRYLQRQVRRNPEANKFNNLQSRKRSHRNVGQDLCLEVSEETHLRLIERGVGNLQCQKLVKDHAEREYCGNRVRQPAPVMDCVLSALYVYELGENTDELLSTSGAMKPAVCVTVR